VSNEALTENPEVETTNDLNGAKSCPSPQIIDAAAFTATPVIEPEQLIAGLFHRGCKLALGGGSKSFKTWTLLDLAVSVSHGLDWLNFPTTQSRVLFVNFELQEWTIQRRLQAVTEAKNITLEPERLSLLNLRGHAANYNLLLPQIAEKMKEDFALVVLDPLYKLYGLTDENKAGDVARLLNAIEDVTATTGAGVAFGSHFSKGNQSQKESIDRISGSGVFARDPDSILTFTRHETDDCFTVEPTLRAFKPVPAFVVRWQYPLMRPETNLDPEKLKQVAGRKREHDPVKLLEVISQNDEENPISISQWALGGNVPRKTLESYLAEMRSRGWIKTVGVGTAAKQAITNNGKAILNGK
jgi:predicted transcriptional regulator